MSDKKQRKIGQTGAFPRKELEPELRREVSKAEQPTEREEDERGVTGIIRAYQEQQDDTATGDENRPAAKG